MKKREKAGKEGEGREDRPVFEQTPSVCHNLTFQSILMSRPTPLGCLSSQSPGSCVCGWRSGGLPWVPSPCLLLQPGQPVSQRPAEGSWEQERTPAAARGAEGREPWRWVLGPLPKAGGTGRRRWAHGLCCGSDSRVSHGEAGGAGPALEVPAGLQAPSLGLMPDCHLTLISLR